MITPDIVSYIKTERAKGTSDSLIHSNLLDNGWNERDIAEAVSALATNPSLNPATMLKTQINNAELKKHRNKRTWITFAVLALIDFIIIMYMGGNGLFGVSPLSILIRIVVIYGIASFASLGSGQKKTAAWTVVDSIARVIATLFIAWIIIVGLLFLYCLFAFNGHSGL